MDSNPLAKARRQRLRNIAKAARNLKELLTDETGAWVEHQLRSFFPLFEGEPRPMRSRNTIPRKTRIDPAPSLGGLKHGLARLGRTAAREAHRRRPGAIWRQERNAAEWLMGVELPLVFERWFRRKPVPGRPHRPASKAKPGHPGRGESWGKADSPYIRFAKAAMKEAGIISNRGTLYDTESISGAMKGRTRRKPRPSRERIGCLFETGCK